MMKCASAKMSGRGQRGTTSPFMAGYRMKNKLKTFRKRKRKKKWRGLKPKTDEQNIEFRKKVMEKKR